jgi:hypothetical protein
MVALASDVVCQWEQWLQAASRRSLRPMGLAQGNCRTPKTLFTMYKLAGLLLCMPADSSCLPSRHGWHARAESVRNIRESGRCWIAASYVIARNRAYGP